MTLTPSEVASLTKALSRWEIGEYACAGLVTIGCLGEYIADFTNWFTDGIKEQKERLAKRSTLLLIAALSLELVCLVRTNELSGLVIGSLDERSGEAMSKSGKALGNSTSALTQSGMADAASARAVSQSGTAVIKSGKALKEADSFEADISVAKKQAAEAESHLAEAVSMARAEETELRELETRLAPRVLTVEQLVRIRAKLKALGAHEYTLWITPDLDSWTLMANLGFVFDEAGWKYVSSGGISIGRAGIMVTERIRIGVVRNRLDDLGPVAEAVSKILIAEGLAKHI
jgi:hypothetical protein